MIIELVTTITSQPLAELFVFLKTRVTPTLTFQWCAIILLWYVSFSTTSTWYRFLQNLLPLLPVSTPVSSYVSNRVVMKPSSGECFGDHPASGSRHWIVNSSVPQLKLIDVRSITPSGDMIFPVLLCYRASRVIFQMCSIFSFDSWSLCWHNCRHFSLVHDFTHDVLWVSWKCFFYDLRSA